MLCAVDLRVGGRSSGSGAGDRSEAIGAPARRPSAEAPSKEPLKTYCSKVPTPGASWISKGRPGVPYCSQALERGRMHRMQPDRLHAVGESVEEPPGQRSTAPTPLPKCGSTRHSARISSILSGAYGAEGSGILSATSSSRFPQSVARQVVSSLSVNPRWSNTSFWMT